MTELDGEPESPSLDLWVACSWNPSRHSPEASFVAKQLATFTSVAYLNIGARVRKGSSGDKIMLTMRRPMPKKPSLYQTLGTSEVVTDPSAHSPQVFISLRDTAPRAIVLNTATQTIILRERKSRRKSLPRSRAWQHPCPSAYKDRRFIFQRSPPK